VVDYGHTFERMEGMEVKGVGMTLEVSAPTLEGKWKWRLSGGKKS